VREVAEEEEPEELPPAVVPPKPVPVPKKPMAVPKKAVAVPKKPEPVAVSRIPEPVPVIKKHKVPLVKGTYFSD